MENKEFVEITFPIKDADKVTEEEAVLQMIEGLKKLVELGGLKGKVDDFVQNYRIEGGSGFAVAVIDKDAVRDPSYLQTLGAGYSYPSDFDLKTVLIEDKNFSVSSIKERVRVGSMPIKTRFRYIILDYKRFFNQNKRKVLANRELAKTVRNLFLMDIMGIFNEVVPMLEEGKQLSQLTGLSTLTKDMMRVSKELSMAYRRAMKQLNGQGQMSKTNISILQEKYSEFMNMLIPQIFPGIEETLAVTKQESEVGGNRYIYIEQGEESSKTLYEILQSIMDKLNENSDVSVTIRSGDYNSNFNLGKGDSIVNLNHDKISENFTYSYTNDGRIKIL